MNDLVIDERTRLIALALTHGIGWKLINRLMDRFGSFEAIFSASAAQLRSTPGIGRRLADRILAVDVQQVAREVQRYEAEHISVVTWQDAAYPARIGGLDDKPLILLCKGALTASDAQAIAIVGTRYPQPESLALANDWAAALASCGWTVVSGLARGIDSAAHRGALIAGGRTLAVLGCGINRIYPRENITLAQQITGSGALLSEVPPATSPTPNTLVRRNRLITGLSRAVIVVEAGGASGALYAARYAQAQGRPVFAANNSAGNTQLLDQFAYPLPDPLDADGLIQAIEQAEQTIVANRDSHSGPEAVGGSTQMMLF